MSCLQEIHFKYKDKYRLNISEKREIYYANSSQKKPGIVILISDHADFILSKVIRDIDDHYIRIMESILQVDLITLNVCIPDKRASKYMRQKQIELQKGID